MANDPPAARSPGLTYQQLLDTDTHEVPAVLRLESPQFLGDEDVSIDRYISREWHEREKERLWTPGVAVRLPRGAHPRGRRLHVYDIVGRSFLSSAPPTTRSRPTPTPASTAAAS